MAPWENVTLHMFIVSITNTIAIVNTTMIVVIIIANVTESL